MRSRVIFRWITAIYLALLFVGAVIPLGSRAEVLQDSYTFDIRWDYLLHVLVYLPMPFLMGLTMKRDNLFWVRVIAFSLIITVLFEAIQLVIPYRAFNINDMLANALGVLIGLTPAVLLWRRFSGSGRSVSVSGD